MIHIQVTVTGMLKFPRFEQWPCTDRTVNVKQLLVSDANTETVEGELNVIYKLNPSSWRFAETR